LRLGLCRLELRSARDQSWNGFLLSALGCKFRFISTTPNEGQRWYDCLKTGAEVVLLRLDNDYKSGVLLGRGNFAKVNLVWHLQSGLGFAAKSVKKDELRHNERCLVRGRG
jgi:hypothetical protein